MAVWTNRLILFFSSVGIFIGGVLSYAAATNMVPPCGGTANCQAVLSSRLSQIGGVSVAYIGLIGYLLLLSLAGARTFTVGKTFRTLSVLGLAGSGLGLLFSAFLTYNSITETGTTCIWCLSSLATIFILTLLHGAVLQADDPESVDTMPGMMVGAASLIVAFGAIVFETRNLEEAYSTFTSEVNLDAVLLKDILPEESKITGNKDTKVTLIEFADFNCGSCRAAYGTTKRLLEEFNGRVRLAYCHFPLYDKEGHETSLNASIISEMAAKKGKFWSFMEIAMKGTNTERIRTQDGLIAIASEAGIDPAEILAVLNPKTDENKAQYDAYLTKIARDMDNGKDLSITATPTYVLFAEGQPPRAYSSRGLAEAMKDPAIRALVSGK